MFAWLKKHTAVGIAAGVIALCVAAAGIFSLAYGRRYKKENYSCEASFGEDCLALYLNPEPNLFFLPSAKQAEALTKGMTLQKAVALLGKPQNCYMEEGRTIFVWRVKGGEAKASFRADVNRGEFIGDSLFIEDVFIK